jgi:hypothetical protein
MHEVHGEDCDDREARARDQPAPADGRQGRDREEIRRTREEHAHPGVARHGERAVDVEQPPDHVGLDADGRRVEPERVRQVGRKDVREPEQADPGVLDEVTRILDCPIRVVAQGGVPRGLETVEVVVRRADRLAGRDQRERDERHDRDRGAEPGRPGAAAPPLAGTDECQERQTEQHRDARRRGETEQQAGGELAAVDRGQAPWGGSRRGCLIRGAVRAITKRVADRGRIGAERNTDREERQPDGCDMRLVPRGRDLGREPEHRPEREEHGRREPDDRTDRQATDRPPAQDDVDRGQDGEDQPVVRGQAPDGDEGQQQEGGQRREGEQATGDAVGGRDRQDVLEERVARQATARRNGIADGGLPLEECRRLPDEVVVVPVDPRHEVDGERRQRQYDRGDDRTPGVEWTVSIHRPRVVGARIGSGVRWATLCYAPIHLPRSCRSRRTR